MASPASSSESLEERVQGAARIVLMGSQRSGKTSMERVVFGKLSPHETLFVPATSAPTLRLVSSSDLARFAIFDIPGSAELSELSHNGSPLTPFAVFSRCRVLVYVIDAEAEPNAECARFAEVVEIARKVNPRLALEVFVHKVDGDLFLTEEQKLDCRREIEQCVRAELADLKRVSQEELVDEEEVSFSLTSIYDHSVFEAFSKVISKRLVPQRDALEKLLDALVSSCDMEKSFLFDVSSKVYVATDSAPVDSASYELCADAIDVVLDVGSIYAPHLSNDACSAAVTLSNGMALVLDEVDATLAVVCLLRSENLDKKGLIDYNLDCFRKALHQLADLNAVSSSNSAACCS
ncbi:hypothetical protein CTAYLR_002288 [Chrysophaeum taylorii]|uniref:GTP-binding protein n=1 Tax=Chrysophaeum taylorii TaxID=2483200 RepID=A0AAD7UNR0_9STRA|nr:hypothetical protein CTAYLR_002288 [Chrysophaeum taylorii]